MKKLSLLIAIACIIQATALSQSCLPEGIKFVVQQQIDSFQINYPNCTKIEGDVQIIGLGIKNLLGLNSLVGIGGDITIVNADSLTNLEGLENLIRVGGSVEIGKYSIPSIPIGSPSLLNLNGLRGLNSVGENLFIMGNDSLINLDGLSNLDTIGASFIIRYNTLLSLEGISKLAHIGGSLLIERNPLENLAGFSELHSIGGSLNIFYNYSLKNCEGINKLTSVGDMLKIMANKSLENLNGLEELDSIGGSLTIGTRGSIWPHTNQSLNDITAISNISHIGGNLTIKSNSNLTQCAIYSVCNYLNNPNGVIWIAFNGEGCNTNEEVEGVCASSINELNLISGLSISPNPFNTSTTIAYKLKQPSAVQITIYNHLGKQIEVIQQKQSAGKQQVIWNAEGLSSGVYFCVLKTESGIQTMKMIKMKK